MNAPTESVTRSTGTQPRSAPHESAFQQIVGRLPNGEERARFDALRSTLRLRDDDAVWTLFVALDYYLDLYKRFPAMIRDAACQLLTECKTESDRNIAHAKQQVHETLQQRGNATIAEVAQAAVAAHASLEKTIQQSARRIALASGCAARWPWMLGGTVIIATALIFTGAVFMGYGRQQGYASGYTAGYTVAMQPQQPATTPPRRGR